MKNLEQIKFIAGIILVSFSVIGGFVFFFESFGILSRVLTGNEMSYIFKAEESSSMTPIFLGLCGIAGAQLLSSVKPNR